MRTWLLAVVLATPGPLAAQGLRFDGGLGVSSGTYLFQERTTTWTTSAGLALELGRFTVRGSIPFHLQNGTLVAGTGLGHVPTGGSSSGTVSDTGAARHRGSREGMGRGDLGPELSHGVVEVPASAADGYEAAVGDPLLGASWRAEAGRGTLVAVGATVKVPVADTATYGTGEWDFGANVAVSRRLARGLLLGLDLAWWRLGDMDDLELRDPVYGTASLGYLSERGWGGSLMASGGSSVLAGYDPPFSVGAGVHRISGSQSWGLLATLGLTETAPDFTLGGLWSVRLTR